MKTKLIFGVGIPGSGKTTALKDLAEKNDYCYICPDDIRQLLSGNAIDQSRMREVWEIANQKMVSALSNGQTVVFDATFAKQFDRQRLIDLAKANGAEKIQAVYADIDLETAKERNANRERVVPDHAIERMHANLTQDPPDIAEGIDSIFSINEFQELQNVERGEEPNPTERRLS